MMRDVFNFACEFSILDASNKMYLIYVLIGLGILFFILLLSLIFNSKRVVIFMVGDEEIIRVKCKKNQKSVRQLADAFC